MWECTDAARVLTSYESVMDSSIDFINRMKEMACSERVCWKN